MRVTPSPTFADVNAANDTATVSASLASDLAIAKTAPTSYTPGAPFTYQIDVLNNGGLPVYGASVTDQLPTGLDGTWSCAPLPGPAAICRAARTTGALHDIVDLAPRAAVRYTLTVTVPPGQSGQLVNTARVDAPAGWVEANLANNTATVTSTAAPSADLYVSKSSTPKPYVPGQTLTYTMVVTNRGPSNVTGARVQDNLPAALAGFGWKCTPSSGATCPTPATGTGNINVLVNLSVGASATFELSGVLGSTVVGPIQNTVTVTPPVGVADPVPGNNSVTDNNSPTPPPSADLVITKSGRAGPIRSWPVDVLHRRS